MKSEKFKSSVVLYSTSKMAENYSFFMKADLSNYIGKWIAICDDEIVAHGSSAKKVFAEAKKKCPAEKPLLTRVPEKETMIF